MGNSRRSYDSVDFISAVLIIITFGLCAFKLLGVIDISWFYITLPVWLPTALLSSIVGYFALLTRLEEFAKRDLKNK